MLRHVLPAATACLTFTCLGIATTAANTVPPGYTTARTDGPHDFDYFAGGWTTVQRRLTARSVGRNAWETFPATLCMTPYLGGLVTADEVRFPTKGWASFTLRSYDLARRQWSIWWSSSANSRLEAPVVGASTATAASSRRGRRRRAAGQGPLCLEQTRRRPRALGTGVLLRRNDLGDERDRRFHARGQRGNLSQWTPARTMIARRHTAAPPHTGPSSDE